LIAVIDVGHRLDFRSLTGKSPVASAEPVDNLRLAARDKADEALLEAMKAARTGSRCMPIAPAYPMRRLSVAVDGGFSIV
jgi:hypothetical protein